MGNLPWLPPSKDGESPSTLGVLYCFYWGGWRGGGEVIKLIPLVKNKEESWYLADFFILSMLLVVVVVVIVIVVVIVALVDPRNLLLKLG